MADIVQLNAHAVLIQSPQGIIHLFHEKHLYRRADVVPEDSLLKVHTSASIKNAGDYVIACMVEAHGSSIENWPDLAREFLLREEMR